MWIIRLLSGPKDPTHNGATMTPKPEWTKPSLIALTAARDSEGGKVVAANENTAPAPTNANYDPSAAIPG
jgi:hypothetical protein